MTLKFFITILAFVTSGNFYIFAIAIRLTGIDSAWDPTVMAFVASCVFAWSILGLKDEYYRLNPKG